jgi:hypothetical protein
VHTLRNILFLALTLFTFVGSIGVGVYSHFCSKDGVEQSYFVRQAHHCDEEEIVLPSCCKQGDSEVQLKNDCCSDQVQLVQIELDYFQQISHFTFSPFLGPVPLYDGLVGTNNLELLSKCNFANPPPKRSGRDIIIQNQVFLL